MDIKHQNVAFGPEESQEGAASVAPYTGGLHRHPGGENAIHRYMYCLWAG